MKNTKASSWAGVIESMFNVAIIFGPDKNLLEHLPADVRAGLEWKHEQFKEGNLRPKQESDAHRLLHFIERLNERERRWKEAIDKDDLHVWSIYLDLCRDDQCCFYYVAADAEHAAHFHRRHIRNHKLDHDGKCWFETLASAPQSKLEVWNYPFVLTTRLAPEATFEFRSGWQVKAQDVRAAHPGVVGYIGFSCARWGEIRTIMSFAGTRPVGSSNDLKNTFKGSS